ncbi:hypothetical protein KJ708_02185, partial [bacterium]|nr:hypothetical protein [bacterium]
MSGTKPVGQGIQVNHASIENISPKSLDTKAINRLDGFAQLDGMEGFPSVFRHSGLLMPGQTGLFASQDSIETKYGDVNVIPLEEMDTILSDPKLQEQEPKDLVTMTAAFNVAFYGNWEPEAMSLEFDQAHKTLKETQIQPGPILMALEAAYAPNEGRFVEWVTMRMDLWNDRGSYCSLEDKGDLNMTMAVTYGWYDQLSQDSKSKVNELFRKTHEIINAKEFSFSKDMTGGYGAFALMGRVLSEQLLYSRVSRFADKEEEEFQLSADLFSEEADPKETFKALDEHNVFYGEIPKKWLDSIWHLMNNQAEEIMEMEDYWMHMRTFLRDHPQYIDAFFQRHDYWEAKMIHGEGETTYTKSSDLKICYESLAGSGLVPEEYKLQVYRYILGYHGPKTFAAFLEIEDANLLEEKLISYCILDQVKEDPEIYNTALGFGRDLLGMRLKEWGADDLTAFLKRILPEDIQEQMSISWKIVRLMLDQDRDAVDFFLSQSQGIQDIVDQSIVEDPLWAFLWSELIPTGSGLMFLDWYSSGDKYKVALGEVPDLLINTGNQDVLEAFYQANHPYKTLYDLPADLRPTGRGLSFVSIDEFGNPKHIKHLDKKHVRNINGDSDYWADVDKDDSATHGVSTSSLAVGKEYGLAPDAKLYLAPVDIE